MSYVFNTEPKILATTTWIAAFALFYNKLSADQKDFLDPILESEWMLDDIQSELESPTLTNKNELEYKKTGKNEYMWKNFSVIINNLEESPIFLINWIRYNIDIWPTYGVLSFPDWWVNNNSYFVEKEGTVYIKFERNWTWHKYINLNDLESKIGSNSNLDS